MNKILFLLLISNIFGQSIVDVEEKYAQREPEIRAHEPFPHPLSKDEITIDLREVRRHSSNGSDPLSPVRVSELHDRKGFLKKHIDSLINKSKCYGCFYKSCLCLNVGWMGLSGAASAATVIVSAIGAADFIDPKISNVTSTCLATFAGFCVWAGTQAKKTSHQYYKARNNINSSLGVPENLLEPEVILNIHTLRNQSNVDGTSAATN
jgi:hypothetical protein